jgi:hypothetical protein
VALAIAAPAHADTVISDPAGDANGLGAAGISQGTAPVSDATCDLTSVTITREPGTIVVRYALTAAPDTDGPLTFAIVRARQGACTVFLAAGWGSLDGSDHGILPISDVNGDDCPRWGWGASTYGHTLELHGTTIVARFSLEHAQLTNAPLTSITAETLVGTWYMSGQVSSCDSEPLDPSCPWPVYDNYYESGFAGAVVDKAVAPVGEKLAALRPKVEVNKPKRRATGRTRRA